MNTDPTRPRLPTPLASRSPFTWLRERDIDLLFCSELHARGALARLIAERINAPDAEFAGAWVSHDELEGESDLVVAYCTPTGTVLALIENKIAAGFQPEQGARYALRAARWRQSQEIAGAVTVLMAPEEYFSRPGSEAFEQKLAYEEAAVALQAEADPRAAFLAEALQVGISTFRRGYVANPDERVSEIWNVCWEVARQIAPGLRWIQPGPKPAQATWFTFYDADSLSADRRHVSLVFKAERGLIDLQFASTTVDDLSAQCAGILAPGMEVVAAGKSASIRLTVTPIDFTVSSASQLPVFRIGIEACERMRAYYQKHRPALLA